MEPNNESVEKIKKFVKETGIDINTIKDRWDNSTLEDQNLRLMHCAVFTDPESWRLYKSWEKTDLSKFGIEKLYDFWSESFLTNVNLIKNEEDAIRVVYESLVLRLRSTTKQYHGVIVSVGMKRDNLSDFINQTLDAYKRDPGREIKYKNVKVYNDIETLCAEYPELKSKISDKYYIDGNYVIPIGKKDITILKKKTGKTVTKRDWFGGKFDGKPVVGYAFMQTVNVIAMPKDGDKYRWYDMILNDEMCDIEKPRNVFVDFEASISPSNNSRLNPVSSTVFKEVGELDMDAIYSVINRRKLLFNDIPEYVNKTQGKSFDVKAIEVKVLDVFVSDNGATILAGSPEKRTMEDMSKLLDDNGRVKDVAYYFKVSQGIPINFGRGSKILVFGTPSYDSKRVGDRWETDTSNYSMWVNGILVPKDQQVDDKSVNVPQEEVDVTKWSDEVTSAETNDNENKVETTTSEVTSTKAEKKVTVKDKDEPTEKNEVEKLSLLDKEDKATKDDKNSKWLE